MKRVFDFSLSLVALLIFSPIFLIFSTLVFFQDFKSPFYIANRVGIDGKLFRMVKLRSMVVNADKSGLASTSNNDMRITPLGKIIRRYKLDELTQLWNVFRGDMSLVGPRPNVTSDVNLYTEMEYELLSVKPGITDMASIVYSDEGDILSGHSDADKAYQQLIRPGKGALGYYYVKNKSLKTDVYLIYLTVVAILSKPYALRKLCKFLKKNGADNELIKLASRQDPLVPAPPLGGSEIFAGRCEN